MAQAWPILRTWIGVICGAVALAIASHASHAQGFPDHPIRIITPTTPGGPLDVMARLIGKGVEERWKQTVVVDPRPGGAQNIAAELFNRSPADGYTLMLAAPTPYVINPHLFRKLNYDSSLFEPVTILVSTPNYLVVRGNFPARSLSELIALVKSKPGAFNYGSVGIGSTQHLAGEAFKLRAGLDLVHVPYKGSSEVLTDLIGERVDIAFMNVVDAMPQVEAGKLRPLAVAADARTQDFPDLPAIAEFFPGFRSDVWFGLAAPPKTPPAIVERINELVGEALNTDQAKKIIADGHATAVLNTPAEAAAFMKRESDRYREVIVKNGISVE